ncbi:hypothetical protein [Methylobacterium marchantiae]|uniref:Phage holin family protein n=1 Tax=Methylobacterium marchantiae TaxID=600331 RepID=A0ABW3WZX9_9HYPH|nr:hypothetical protein AIGOOFII_0734 [Methylobacterium marchantiae]
MTIQILSDDADPEARRVRRHLARLQALLERRRLRVTLMRGARGLVGGGASFAALVKLKLAGSLVLKGGLAVLVGLCFAWPIVAGLLLALLLVVLAVVGAMEGEAPSLPDTCWSSSGRRDKLRELIDERVRWLDGRSGPAPRYRRP